jgi:hypothetical protein
VAQSQAILALLPVLLGSPDDIPPAVPGANPTEQDQAAGMLAKLSERYFVCRMRAPPAPGTPGGGPKSEEGAAAAATAAAGAVAGEGTNQRGSTSSSEEAAATEPSSRRTSSPDPSGKRCCFGLPAPGTPLEYESMPWNSGRGSWADAQEEI